jgi:hypothetical protein
VLKMSEQCQLVLQTVKMSQPAEFSLKESLTEMIESLTTHVPHLFSWTRLLPMLSTLAHSPLRSLFSLSKPPLHNNSTTKSKHKPQSSCTALPNPPTKPHPTCARSPPTSHAKHELELAHFPSPEGTPESRGHLQGTSLQNCLDIK